MKDVKYDGFRAGQEIRRLRNSKRLSILEMSGHIQTSASHLNQIELGVRKMSIDMLYKLMDELDTDANTLLAVPNKADLIGGISIDAELRKLPTDKQRYLISVFKQMITGIPI